MATNIKTEGSERPVKKIRRRAFPYDVHQLYDAISHWTNNVMKQQATMERIVTYMKAHYGVDEGLIDTYTYILGTINECIFCRKCDHPHAKVSR